eukprot:760129-Hanusia_phi.AAC.5
MQSCMNVTPAEIRHFNIMALLSLLLSLLHCCNSADCIPSQSFRIPEGDTCWKDNGFAVVPYHMNLENDLRLVRDCFYCRSNSVEKGLAVKNSWGTSWVRFMCSGCSKRVKVANSSYEALPLRPRCFFCTRKVTTSIARRYGVVGNRLCCYHVDMADQLTGGDMLRRQGASAQGANGMFDPGTFSHPSGLDGDHKMWGEPAFADTSAAPLAGTGGASEQLRPYTKQKPRAWQETKRAYSLRRNSATYYVRNREKVLARRRVRKALNILLNSNSTRAMGGDVEALAKRVEANQLKLVFCDCHAKRGEKKHRCRSSRSSSPSDMTQSQSEEGARAHDQLETEAVFCDRLQGYIQCSWCLRYHHHMQSCQKVSMQPPLPGVESCKHAEGMEQVEFERDWSWRQRLVGIDGDFLSSLSS